MLSCQFPHSGGAEGELLPTGPKSPPSSGSCHDRDSCCFLYLSDNDIIYLAGSFGWFSFNMLHEFSISLSPPPSADENDGVRVSNYW